MNKIQTKKLSLQDCLSNVIDNRGVTPHKRGIEWQEQGIPVLSANNIKTTGLQNEDQIRYIPEEAYDSWMKMPLERGDIILTSEAPAGEVFYWDSDEKIVLGQRLYGLKIKKDISSLYLKYYLQSAKGQAEIRNKCSGSTVFGISAKTFSSIEIILPERKEIQDKVGALLKCIDDKILNNKRICDELESTVSLVFSYWFLQYDFPNEKGKPYKESGGKLVWNEMVKANIPEKWSVRQLGDLFSDQRGISYNTQTIEDDIGVPMINLASFSPDGSYKEEGIKTYSGEYAQEKVLKPYDLVICNTQQTAIDFKKDIIGKALIIPDIFEGDIVYSHHVTKISVYDEPMKYYLYRMFNTDYYHKFVSGYTNGTNILGLLFDGIKQSSIVVPDDTTIRRFAELVQNVEEEKSNIIKENQELSSLRDFLLPLLLNGQIGFK